MRIKELTLSTEPIKFSDPEIKRRYIKAGWDLDGDGEISYAEAAKVKDIRGIFSEYHIGRYLQGVARKEVCRGKSQLTGRNRGRIGNSRCPIPRENQQQQSGNQAIHRGDLWL